MLDKAYDLRYARCSYYCQMMRYNIRRPMLFTQPLWTDALELSLIYASVNHHWALVTRCGTATTYDHDMIYVIVPPSLLWYGFMTRLFCDVHL